MQNDLFRKWVMLELNEDPDVFWFSPRRSVYLLLRCSNSGSKFKTNIHGSNMLFETTGKASIQVHILEEISFGFINPFGPFSYFRI